MRDACPDRAVMYVRMSTESQDYSTDHQRAKLQEYAETKGMMLVREYVDDGKSGLDIKRRAGLTALMKDVQSTEPDFSHILVYDISRWGRFQDIDEAAYHEHTCRRAGITVVYCGERFSDDGGPYAALLKSMKRVMAAEYSRDLSEKVFIAQSRFIKMGFKQGGHAGYGLRRLALKADGTPRAILEYGESKVSATDRVILVWGPDEEVATVRRVYSLYLNGGYSESRIVRLLNSEGIPSEFNRPWTQAMLNSLLTNVKYCGALAYNRRSCKLSKPRTRNQDSQWVVNPAAVPPIISRALFDAAQAERARRLRRFTAAELIALLQGCHQRHGKVNAKVIAADLTMPDPQLFVRTFGSLVSAYDMAGLPRSVTYAFVHTKRRLTAIRSELVSKVEALTLAAGSTIERTPEPSILILNGDLRVQIQVAVPRNPKRGVRNWRVFARPGVDFIITARMGPTVSEIADYFLLDAPCLAAGPVYLKDSNLDRYSTSRYTSLADMFSGSIVDQPETLR
ncbi:hypothetical protein B0920_14665 [Massilia sp. KIM]|uniref:recombinase family protein n=1 Tax=Massilia sp. KIM TaxID=1955422 RepID=UPI00098F7918|nr:recombinase family protein [Massilia sp. KIM]OON64514.1 hypothetical protein B0920_14665 [Massilia sp. KIM]